MGEIDNSSSDHTDPPLTILVVEDELLIRLAIADFLRDCGFRVLETGSADDAVQILSSEETVQVIFTDIQMPGALDGFGLAHWVRKERPDLKVILTSGVRQAIGAAADLCGEGGLILKPYEAEEVERRIRQLTSTSVG